MGPRARITTDDGGGIDQAVSKQLASRVKVKGKVSRARPGREPNGPPMRGREATGPKGIGETAVVMIVVVVAIVVVAIVVVAAAAVVTTVATTEVRETTAAKHR